MVLQPLFILCIGFALNDQYTIDVSWVLVFLFWPRMQRKVWNDFRILLLASVLLYVLPKFETWRYYYPIKTPEFLEYAGQLFGSFLQVRIDRFSSGPYHGFLTAIFRGDKSNISTETVSTFRHLGMSHMLAVSGFHIGFWVLLMRPLFGWMRGYWSFRLGLFLQFSFLLVYSFTVGAGSSVVRAVWSFGLARYSSLRKDNIPSLHWPMVVALSHYFVDPTAPHSLSFQLSYAAVFAILIALKGSSLEHFTVDFSTARSTSKWLDRLLLPIQISLAAWSATLPIVQHHFGGASPYFLAGNLVAVPLLTVGIWMSVPFILLGDAMPNVAVLWANQIFDWVFFVIQELEKLVLKWG